MPLDASLYALSLQPRAISTGWLDLSVYAPDQVGAGSPAYALHKDHTNGSYNLYDPFTNALLGTSAVAPPSLPNATPNPKHRLIRLFDPDVEVHIWNQTGLSWSWTMDWEETQYVWTREVASLLGSDRAFTLSVNRKPDPNFPVLQYRPHRKGDMVEILDHNISRLEPPVRDRKGFEVAALLALAFFIDHTYPATTGSTASSPIASTSKPSAPAGAPPAVPLPKSRPAAAPSVRPPSPKRSPPPVKASPRIQVTDISPRALDAHCKYCLALLEDRYLPGLVLVSESPAHQQALTQLAERIQRKRLKATRGSDTLQVVVTASGSSGAGQEARPAAGGGLWAYLTGTFFENGRH
ncbi:hypothetical protein BMF94_1673 [Rhodotorula taiwanensis]|uniref:Uncharacterized protein n=1 Tax=Rhodotorula taiwanensis TaxID=741276 RepID=A0A2S5BEV6_9BASI|nr:hypothetical protein BMF94_1673 [Rhodotorula taiwanensis]